MNASDDRKREQFEERINGTTAQARTINLHGGAGRPNCLIIDEIDGAPSVGLFCLLCILPFAELNRLSRAIGA